MNGKVAGKLNGKTKIVGMKKAEKGVRGESGAAIIANLAKIQQKAKEQREQTD